MTRVSVLGPLQVEVGGRVIPLPARKERTLLAALVLRHGQIVSADALVDVLWGDEPPRSSAKTLQTYVSKLRRALGDERIVTEARGYRLVLAPDELDLMAFADLSSQGQKALRDDDVVTAAALLGDALGLWRGSAFEEFAMLPAFVPEVTRLEELRATVTEDRIDAQLALGQHVALIGQLEALVAERPLRERLWSQLMLAMYRAGRQADALHAFQRARRALAEELGLDPGPALRSLETRVLAQDPSLDLRPEASPRPRSEPERVTIPPTRYARRGPFHLAYQVSGNGPPDLLLLNEWWSHVEAVWEHPDASRFLRRAAELGRTVCFDGRGTGMSDPIDHDAPLSLEQWVDDALAVLDAVGLEQVVVFGQGTGGAAALLLAAMHPERVNGLVLHNAQTSWAETFHADPHVTDRAAASAEALEAVVRRWGQGPGHPIAPSYDDDPDFDAWFGRLQRQAVSPGQLRPRLRMLLDVDVRPLAPSIGTPTLIVHTTGNRIIPIAAARRLAAQMPTARLAEVPGDDHLWFAGGGDAALDHVEAFLADRGERAPDRVLATIVSIGLDDATPHYRGQVERVVQRYRGTLTDLDHRPVATFDGPARAVTCARVLLDAAVPQGVGIRIGVHTGEVDRGRTPVSGPASDIADHLARLATPGQALVSRTVVDLVAGSGLPFGSSGTHDVPHLGPGTELFTVATD